jgi:hypothetical protein
VGAAFSPEKWPTPWRGRFFFADWAANWIKTFDPDKPTNVVTFAKGLNAPVALEFAPDGSLLVLNRGTIWRDGQKFLANSGSLLRIRLQEQPTVARETFPRDLADTGLFESELVPRETFTAFHVNSPPWQPGVTARRWIELPTGTQLHINADGEFEFPIGTIVVQQFLRRENCSAV